MRSPSRRHVLRSGITIAIAAGVAPLVRDAGKEIDMDDVMGTGRHVYELDRDWPKLPASMKLGYTHGVAVDSQNRIIVFNQSADAVLLLDSDGKLIKSWNHGFERGAHGLTLNKEADGEFLYLCDYELPRVCKTTLDAEIVWIIHDPPPLVDVYKEKGKY